MVDEIDPVDLRGNAGHLSGHAGDHGSSRDQKIFALAFWRKLVYHTQP